MKLPSDLASDVTGAAIRAQPGNLHADVPDRAPLRTIRALMTHIIDYAGLFPPAELDMKSTVENYANYQASDDSWALARLVIPAGRFDEFESCAAGHFPTARAAEPWPISALAAPASDAQQVENDLNALADFNSRHESAKHGRAVVDAVELRAMTAGEIETVLDILAGSFIMPFFELPAAGDLRGMIAALAGADAAAKVRTGGATQDLFPKPDDLARFTSICAKAGVSFKATAGLHHPFTHESADVAGATEFGFINAFLGAALAVRDDVSQTELAEILADRDPEHFAFAEDSIRWRDRELTVKQIEDTRSKFALSFGSCSFEEPLEDIRRLRLI